MAGLDSLVQALLHGDGANDSTTIVDSSFSGRTFTANGNAKIKTAQLKFGGSSLHLPGGAGDYIESAAGSQWAFPGDFAVECWFYPTALPASTMCVMGCFQNGTATDWMLYTSAAGKLEWYSVSGAPITSTTSLSLNTWHHGVVARTGTTRRLFLNGTQEASDTFSDAIGTTWPLRIGADKDGNVRYTGYVDEVRITKGFGRYTADFTPPTAAYNAFNGHPMRSGGRMTGPGIFTGGAL